MKTLFLLLAATFMGSAVIAQTPVAGTVTINVTGNRIKQVQVDNMSYDVNSTTVTDQKTITIGTLANGQHSLTIFRKNQFNTTSSKTSFTLREGFDLTINISANGVISSTEQRIETWRGGGNRPISTSAFNKLYAQVKKKTSSSARTSFLENEFENTNKKFTSRQASTLIQLVNSESMRLKLAKAAYSSITDKENFSLVSSLLKSTASRTELNNYIAGMAGDDTDDSDDNGNAYTPMNNERFRVIYNEVMAESSASDKNYYLSNFFSKDFNYYTSSQARQLIQLVPAEAERFYLAKVAYRGITDRENYSEVSQLLTSSYNRAELATYISTYDKNNARPAMSITDFNRLYQAAYAQSSNTARFSSINTSLTTPGYYFTVTQAKQLIQLMPDEYSRLQLAKTSYKVLVDRANYTQLNELLNSTASRNELNNYVANYDNVYNPGTGVAMSDADYNRLYSNISNSWSASSRFNLAADAFVSTSNYFSVYQVRQLLLLFNTESERLSLAKSAYDNVIDKNNFTQLYEVFSTTANRNELARFVSEVQNGGGVVYKTPMSDANYNSIVRDIQFTFGLGAKMSALTEVFNKETNYFTVTQAKQLIQMVSAEYNRLELAKAAYNNLTDPANYTQFYDLFTTQASKDELNTYVGSNAYINK